MKRRNARGNGWFVFKFVTAFAFALLPVGACATSTAPKEPDAAAPPADADVIDGSYGGSDADASDDDAASDASPDAADSGPDTGVLPVDAGPPPCLSSGVLVGPFQTFTDHMYGCAGKVAWTSASSLCNTAAGCQVCRAAEWIAKSGSTAPTHDYWTADDLKFSGAGTLSCSVSLTTGSECDTNMPMRVCVDNNAADPNGNACNWTNCGYEATTPNDHFGGCDTNATAGTICCCP